MQIYGTGKETYLFLNGIEVTRPIRLGEHLQLLPAKCPTHPDLILTLFKKDIDVGVAIIFLSQIKSQIHVVADTPKELATRAWNSLWDATLLSALFHCDAICNFQSNTAANDVGPISELFVTNYYLRGFSPSEARTITESEATWIEQNFEKARKLLDQPQFLNAVHSLASYTWHSLPRARLALLWSGIEGLFAIDQELVFRLSLYASRFLHPNSESIRKEKFKRIKQLYKHRSQAVHGSEIKGDTDACINESATLLLELIQQCITNDSMPDIDTLAP